MRRFVGILSILLAVLALASPSFATGVCVAHGGMPLVSAGGTETSAQLPNPCELQGGKRVLPAQPDLSRHVVDDPFAVAALWARGLVDGPLLKGRSPALELPPPRLG